MMGVLKAEVFAARRRPGMWVVGGGWLTLAVLFGMIVPVIVYHAISGNAGYTPADRAKLIDTVLPEHFVAAGVSLYPLFGSAMMLLLGVIMMGGEYRWRTLGTLFVQGPSRLAALAGKWLTLAVTSLAVTVVLFAALALVAFVVAEAEGQPARWPHPGVIVGGIAAAWLASLAAATVGVFLAIVFRGTGTAIGVGLVWLLGLENAVSQIAGLVSGFTWLQRLLIGPSAGSLAVALGSPSQSHGGIPGVVSTSPPWLAVVVLAGYVAVFGVLAGVLVRRRDVTG